MFTGLISVANYGVTVVSSARHPNRFTMTIFRAFEEHRSLHSKIM
jgi:hypothetical protein